MIVGVELLIVVVNSRVSELQESPERFNDFGIRFGLLLPSLLSCPILIAFFCEAIFARKLVFPNLILPRPLSCSYLILAVLLLFS